SQQAHLHSIDFRLKSGLLPFSYCGLFLYQLPKTIARVASKTAHHLLLAGFDSGELTLRFIELDLNGLGWALGSNSPSVASDPLRIFDGGFDVPPYPGLAWFGWNSLATAGDSITHAARASIDSTIAMFWGWVHPASAFGAEYKPSQQILAD